MPVTIVLGSQWGDEGKGKLVDILASHASMCCRAAGGNNAGHTIVANGQTYDFHILPSGLINPSCKVNLVGAGCVVHLPSFFKELDALEQKGLQGVRQRVKISDRAQVCFDLHSLVDGISEDILKGKDGGKGMIGTTKKGIGPCYSDKVGRRGVTFSMLVSENGPWEQRLRDLYERYVGTYSDKPAGRAAMEQYDLEGEIARMKKYKDELVKGDYILDATPFLSRVVGHFGTSAATLNGPSGEPTTHIDNVLIEGANALLLDIDHGTYPYVTSSNTGLGGVFTGLAGLSPLALTSPGSAVVGVVKAYTTRVGAGPFPTELASHVHDVSESEAAYGTKLQEVGREWGVTTGRKRRCGWLDLVLLKYSAQVNCYTQLNFTKLDVLDDFPEIRVAMAYKDKRTGKELPGFPADLDLMEHHLEIVYKTFEGWQTKTTGCQKFEDLPAKAKEYIEFVEREAGVPIKWIGMGPRREDMIVRNTL